MQWCGSFPCGWRMLMGVRLILFGLNEFFHFIPPPATSQPKD